MKIFYFNHAIICQSLHIQSIFDENREGSSSAPFVGKLGQVEVFQPRLVIFRAAPSIGKFVPSKCVLLLSSSSPIIHELFNDWSLEVSNSYFWPLGVLLPQNIYRFSGSTFRLLLVVLPVKSPGVIILDYRIISNQKILKPITKYFHLPILQNFLFDAKWSCTVSF